MVLVDTNIWIGHFRGLNNELVPLLNVGSVACHEFIIDELAAVNLKNRTEILSLFQSLPSTPVVESHEYLEFVESRKLMGKGPGSWTFIFWRQQSYQDYRFGQKTNDLQKPLITLVSRTRYNNLLNLTPQSVTVHAYAWPAPNWPRLTKRSKAMRTQ